MIAAQIKEVEQFIQQGHKDKAITLAKSRNTRDINDSDLHLHWATILEELGLPEESALELNLAIRDAPDRVETYHKLSDLLLDLGRPDKAAHVWAALVKIKPNDPECYERLGETLKEAREYERAVRIYQVALEKTQDPRFKALLKEISFVAGHTDDELDNKTQDSSDNEYLVPQQHHLIRFAALFKSREGVYARQWLSPTGESGYTPVEESMTLKVIENHILGNYTIGSYPVRLDNTVAFTAFDIDIAKFAVAKAVTSKSVWDSIIAKAHQTACEILRTVQEQGISAYIEDSGFKGRHVWIFFETPIPAGVAKKFGESVLTLINGIPPEITVEVFPKQGSVKKGGLGNLIKLPLGLHRRTGRRGMFLEPNGNVFQDQLSFLDSIKPNPRRGIYALIQRVHGGLQSVSAQDRISPDLPWDEPEPELHPAALGKPELEYHLDRDALFQTLVLKCSALKAIIDKVNTTGALDRDETQVVIHTVGHLEHGAAAVNQIFRRCPQTDPSLFLKSRLKGNPMSCPKIRSRLPDVVSGLSCDCVFGSNINLYPNPLNHLVNVPKTDGIGPLGITVDTLQFQNLLVDYIKLRKQLRETMTLLGQYEQRLESFFIESGVEYMETPSGKVGIVRENGTVSFKLEL